MTSHTLARRAAGVSAGALSLCLLSGGVAFADTSGLPPLPSVPTVPSVPGLPSPNNVITTLDQTVKQVTTTQPTTTPPPTTTPSTPAGGTTTTTKPPATKPVSKPVVKAPKSSTSHSANTTTVALPSWSGRVAFDAVTPTDMALPPATGVSAPNGSAPAIAPLLMPQTQHVTPSAALADLDKHSGSPVRAILLGLALAAAAGVGYGHLRVVRTLL